METKLIVQKTLDAIISVLAEEGRVELRALRSGMRRHFVGGSFTATLRRDTVGLHNFPSHEAFTVSTYWPGAAGVAKD